PNKLQEPVMVYFSYWEYPPHPSKCTEGAERPPYKLRQPKRRPCSVGDSHFQSCSSMSRKRAQRAPPPPSSSDSFEDDSSSSEAAVPQPIVRGLVSKGKGKVGARPTPAEPSSSPSVSASDDE